jgi:hypothetical protein
MGTVADGLTRAPESQPDIKMTMSSIRLLMACSRSQEFATEPGS